MTDYKAGDELQLAVEAWAHGGHCVARHDGLVVFVRHALPGERVRARLTQVRSRLARADAIEILEPSPDRVEPPCRYAGPGGCGGCDFQHVSLPAQRRAKTEIVRETMVRIGGLDPTDPLLAQLVVQAVPGDSEGLGWRTRVQFAVTPEGRAGLREHRSHRVVDIETCLLAHPLVAELDIPGRAWPGLDQVEGICSSTGERLTLETPAQQTAQPAGPQDRTSRGRRSTSRRPENRPTAPAKRPAAAVNPPAATGNQPAARVHERVQTSGGDVRLRVTGSGFWQVHPGAPAALTAAVLADLEPQPGESAHDLYGGVGLFTAALVPLLGPDGAITLVESDLDAVRDARRNLHAHPQARIEAGRVERVLPGLAPADLVVLDPPRAGAGAEVLAAITQQGVAAGGPRVISYVACDPAALARDTKTLVGLGYRLDRLRAFDLFPMTQHVECVARFVPE